MKNKITLLMVIGCMIFCATDVIKGDGEYIDPTEESTSSEGTYEDGQFLNPYQVDGEGSATNLDANTDTNTTTDNTSDFLTKNAEATSGEKITQTGTLELSGDESGATNNGSSTSATVQKVSQVDIFQFTQLENGLFSNAEGELVDDQGNVILDQNNKPINALDIEFDDENGNLIDENGDIIRDQNGSPIEYFVEVDLAKEEAAVEEIQESAKQLDPEDPRTVTEALEKINQIIADKTLTVNQAFTEFFAALGDLFAAQFNAIVEAIVEAFKKIDNIEETPNSIPNLITNIEASMENIPEGTPDLSTERISAITDEANDPKNFTGALAILGIEKDISMVTQEDINNALNDPSFQKYQGELLQANGVSLLTFAKTTQAVSTLQDAITPISTTFDPTSNTTTTTYADGSVDLQL